jgi:hypothetical protein
MLIVLAAPRPATAALAHTRKPGLNSIDLHQSTQLRSTAPIASSTATTPISALDPLATTPTPRRRRSNPHSARRTVPPPTARFPPLEVFRRRPLESVASFASGRHPKTFTTADIPPSRLTSRTFALLATDDRALQCSGWSGDAARSPASARPRRDWQRPSRYWSRSTPPPARVRHAPWPAAER